MTDVLAVLHIADLFREPRMKYPSLLDWAKVGRYLRGEWPQPVPPRLVTRADNCFKAFDWLEAAHSAPYIVIDTEYHQETHVLTLIGLGYPGMAQGLQVPWMWGGMILPAVFRDGIQNRLRDLVRAVPVTFQNATADIPVLEKNMGIRYEDYKRVDDTMLAHAVLWSEWPHELAFLASIYGVHPKMKHLVEEDPLLYNWGDVLDTMAAREAIWKEFQADPRSYAVYDQQSLRLIPLILEAQAAGIRVNKARVEPALAEYGDKMAQAAALAEAYVQSR